jgi:cellulose synthase/poly-beta-1,6-N-acetylglucosamine synthase-like glycosyltransferase
MWSWVLPLALVGLCINLLSLASVIVRLMRLQKPRSERRAAVSVILPITGPMPGLETLIGTLNAQTLLPARLIVSVESRDDPAYERVRQAAPMARFPVEIVVAGEARDQAQKCRNQQAALALIEERDQAIVMMDGDIVPQRWWLSALVSPLMDGNFDLVTGHRWQQVRKHRLGAHLVAAIDRAVTLLPRTGWNSTSVVWGGSIGISPAAAERMQLSVSLDSTLSDDLSLAEHASAAGLRVLTRGALLIPSPTDLGLVAAWRFAVRQYRIGHIYRPWLWRMALATVAVRLAAWIAVLWQVRATGDYLWAAIGLAALAVLKQALVGDVARRLDMPDSVPVRLIQLLLGLLQPLVDLFHLSVIVAAAWTRRIRWGHVVYEISGPYSIAVKERLPFPAS